MKDPLVNGRVEEERVHYPAKLKGSHQHADSRTPSNSAVEGNVEGGIETLFGLKLLEIFDTLTGSLNLQANQIVL